MGICNWTKIYQQLLNSSRLIVLNFEGTWIMETFIEVHLVLLYPFSEIPLLASAMPFYCISLVMGIHFQLLNAGPQTPVWKNCTCWKYLPTPSAGTEAHRPPAEQPPPCAGPAGSGARSRSVLPGNASGLPQSSCLQERAEGSVQHTHFHSLSQPVLRDFILCSPNSFRKVLTSELVSWRGRPTVRLTYQIFIFYFLDI